MVILCNIISDLALEGQTIQLDDGTTAIVRSIQPGKGRVHVIVVTMDWLIDNLLPRLIVKSHPSGFY